MNTPIFDFVKAYAASDTARLHMPGHKGKGALGVESLDITEIKGADSLFEADGIIAQSERNASELFSAHSFYSTEGSSLAIRAMVYLASLYAKRLGRRPRILAARNAHRAFVSAAALADCEVEWLTAKSPLGYLSSGDLLSSLTEYLASDNIDKLPTALYITSPDYLGNMQNIKELARLCHDSEMLLLVDNAHGAYLKFLQESLHPMDLGADMCSDSAHKTLPALTGAAYLHISRQAPEFLLENARCALSLFASTSPSYLILSSLDLLNKSLDKGYRKKITDFVKKLDICKQRLTNNGYNLVGNEPMKLTVFAKDYGYTGEELAESLREKKIECEFADRDFTVLMPTPDSGDIEAVVDALLGVVRREKILDKAPMPSMPKKAASIREAIFSPSELLPIAECEGKILADVSVGCPPAVPILFSGEIITKESIAAFKYYGIEKVRVVK